MVELRVPLLYEDIKDLRVGDLVMISGDIFTGRSGYYKKLFSPEEGFPLDENTHNVLLHTGPIIGKDEIGDWKVNAISITTGVRYNKWEPENIRKLHLRAIISKGSVGKETRAAMKEEGCIHLCRTGTFAGAFCRCVTRINSVHWLDLGLPEALWEMHFEGFGPLIVETDVHGNSYYDHILDSLDNKVNAAYKKLGIETFDFAEK